MAPSNVKSLWPSELWANGRRIWGVGDDTAVYVGENCITFKIRPKTEFEITMDNEYFPKRIHWDRENGATIVFWKDGSKTVVRVNNETFDVRHAFNAALAKKVFGSKNQLNKVVDYFKD